MNAEVIVDGLGLILAFSRFQVLQRNESDGLGLILAFPRLLGIREE